MRETVNTSLAKKCCIYAKTKVQIEEGSHVVLLLVPVTALGKALCHTWIKQPDRLADPSAEN